MTGPTRPHDSDLTGKDLPRGTVLVDYVPYTHSEMRGPGKGWQTERRLLAFVKRREYETPVVVSLGALAPIEASLAAWRRSLNVGHPGGVDNKSALLLKTKLLTPLKRFLFDDALLIYASGELATLPFAALPGEKAGTWLIEDRAVVVLCSDPLMAGERAVRPSTGFVGVADIAPGKSAAGHPSAPSLPGTRWELERIAGLYRQAFPDRQKPRCCSASRPARMPSCAAWPRSPSQGNAAKAPNICTWPFWASSRRP